jgi:hypothetical protein
MIKRLMMMMTVTLAVLTAPALTQQMQDKARTPPMPGTLTEQQDEQWLVSEFTGIDVIDDANVKIGDVNDILFDREGKVVAYVISVGGFLGVGAKDVALAPASFQVLRVGRWQESLKLKLSMTKDELTHAAAFEPYKAPTPKTEIRR